MNALLNIKSFITRHVYPASHEEITGFNAVIQSLSRKGMMTAGMLGVLGSAGYVLAKIFFVNTQVAWTYENADPESILVLWDKLLILAVSFLCIVLSYTQNGVRYGRLVLAVIVIMISISSLLDDLISGIGYMTSFLILFMTIAVGTMPYKAWQTLFFGLALMLTIALCVEFLPPLLNVQPMRMSKTVYVFIGLMTLFFTGISAVLYETRFEQYEMRRKAERLREELEVAHESLKASFESLKQAQGELIHSKKMASLGRFTAGISHELKNPLNFVNNFSELNQEITQELINEISQVEHKLSAQEHVRIGELLEDLRENAAHINRHGKRADDIIRQMQEHSRKTALDLRKTDVNALLDQYVSLVQFGSDETGVSVEVERTYSDNLSQIDISPNEMGRAFMNILNNAFHAVIKRAQLAHERYAPRVRISTREHAEAIEIRFVDNGLGIAPDIKENIFEPFFTTTRSGVGLGLSLAYDIITRRYGGSLSFKSWEGIGSVFVIRLPRSTAKRA